MFVGRIWLKASIWYQQWIPIYIDKITICTAVDLMTSQRKLLRDFLVFSYMKFLPLLEVLAEVERGRWGGGHTPLPSNGTVSRGFLVFLYFLTWNFCPIKKSWLIVFRAFYSIKTYSCFDFGLNALWDEQDSAADELDLLGRRLTEAWNKHQPM